MFKKTVLYLVGGLVLLFASCVPSELHVEELPIQLICSSEGVSKAGSLTSGDAVAVFARIDGTENYFLEAQKWVTGSDETSLSVAPAVYYPETKQAVNFYAYFPYHTGDFSVPTDQSTEVALKQADLCWSHVRTTPTELALPLTFEHLMARLVVSANEPIVRLTAPDAYLGGSLDVCTGVFTHTLRSSVSTTGKEKELILPAQSLPRLLITVSGGVDYVFDPPSAVALPSGQSTVLRLTLNPISRTAMLSAPSTSVDDWAAANRSAESIELVDNQFTAHWLIADYRFNQIDRIDLTIKDPATGVVKDYTVSSVVRQSGSTIAAASYVFSLVGPTVAGLQYPYVVTAIKFYQGSTLVHQAAPMSNTVPNRGPHTLGWQQSIVISLSSYSANVSATATSASFTLSTNVPYGSVYTSGGSSAQGSGVQPPYSAYGVTFSFPAQSAGLAVSSRTHTMTMTPTVNYTDRPESAQFVVNQAGIAPSASLSPTSGGTLSPLAQPAAVNLTANAGWKGTGVGLTPSPASGVGKTTAQGVTLSVGANTGAQRTVSATFAQSAAIAGFSNFANVVWSATQQAPALTLSANSASVGAGVGSSSVLLSANVPWTSAHTGTGLSPSSGATPPYSNQSITFTYPVQGASAAAARTFTATFTPSLDYSGNSQQRTFTVTQAAVPTSLTLSATAPGESVPASGKSYTINVMANTSWKSQNGVNGVTTNPASGTGSRTGVQVVVPASALSATRSVSIDLVTTAGLSGVAEQTVKWSGTQSASVPDPTDYVKVGNVYWATGNLIASSSTAGKVGVGGCKIGAPADGGLYFQFGSLIGYKGGNQANGGTGVGMPQAPLTNGGTYWNGSGFTWAGEAQVWPSEMSTTPSAWPQKATINQWYFGLQSDWSTSGQNIRDYPDFKTGNLADKGVGDPCTYYLGGTWRLPTGAEYAAMCNNKSEINASFSWSDVGGTWVTSPAIGGNLQGSRLFFPASGYRLYSSGSFSSVTTYGGFWSSSVYNATGGLDLGFNSSRWVCPQLSYTRSHGFPVRCVGSVP